jgi:glycosyltransferase involved in cell wall biosynthesis
MEIIHLILGKANPNRMNGVNKVVYDLAKQQFESGRNVTVWGISKSGKSEAQDLPFPIQIFQGYKNLFRLDPDLIKVLSEKKENCIVHIHGSWIPTFYRLSRVLKKFQIPYIIMQHGGYNQLALKKGKWKKWIYFPLFEKKVIKHSKIVHCIGQSEVDGIHALGFGHKAHLQAYGFEPNAANTATAKNESHTFCFMGRLDAHTKGLDLLIEAFASFVNEYPESQLWIIGDGKDRLALENSVQEKKLSKSVSFFGALYAEEKYNKMNRCQVFVHPSRNEGLPASIFEAANLKLPIIASKATNFGTSIEKFEAGWVIENEDVKGLYTAMKQSVSSNKNNIKGASAYQMISTDYSWKTILTQIDQMYENAGKK